MMRRLIAAAWSAAWAAAALLTAACSVRSPVSNRLTLDLDRDKEHVHVTSVTEIERSAGDEALRKRLMPLRESILLERDEWSVRFSQFQPPNERIILDRDGGELLRAEHSADLRREDLPRFFSDVPITLQFIEGSKPLYWTELDIYPGSSTRASRQQRDAAEHILDVWSHDVAEYFNRISQLYSWLEQHPQRGEDAFTLIFADEGVHAVDDEEEALVTAARTAITAVSNRLERKEPEAYTIDELFDLVYNPFPAEIIIRTPRPVIESEHFETRGEDTVFIRHAGLIDAARKLENRWISPDPLALLLRADEEHTEMPTAAEMNRMPRKFSPPVSPREVQEALIKAVKPAEVYRVRWGGR
jgi:hypothetical protein